MTRLAILGNSHVGALKRAWDALGDRPEGLELRFFAVPDKQFRLFRLGSDLRFALPARVAAQRPRLSEIARTVNGADWIDLAGTDAVVLCGASAMHREIGALMADYDVDGYRAAGAPRRMSRAAFEAICDDLGEVSLPGRWVGAPIPRLAVLPRPMPAEGAGTSAHPDYAAWRRVVAHPEGARAMVERLIEGLAAAHARKGIGFLRQPPETLEATGLTSGVYTKGSNRLTRDEKHPAEDVSHMNARYGALCLRSILDWAGRDTPAAA